MTDDKKETSPFAVAGIVGAITFSILKGIQALSDSSKTSKSGQDTDGAGVSKNDVVKFQGKDFQVEDIRDFGDLNEEYKNKYRGKIKPGEKIYTLCRYDPVAGVKLKVTCKRVSAKPGDRSIKKVK